MTEFIVEVSRLVWGDHGPRRVGEAGTRETLRGLLIRDISSRMRDDRLGVYSLRCLEQGEDGSRSLICEVVAYGDREELERVANQVWAHWGPPDSPSVN